MAVNKHLRVIAFIHSYRPDFTLDSYMTELVNGFVNCGVDIRVVVANRLVGALDNVRYLDYISEDEVFEYIVDFDPDFILTSNRAGVTKRIMDGVSCPIINWMVDLTPFLHHGGSHDDLFCEKDLVIVSSSNSVLYFEKNYPILKGRVYYHPFATNLRDFDEIKPACKDINVSFVGSYFSCAWVKVFFERYSNDPIIWKKIFIMLNKLEEDYEVDLLLLLQELELEFILDELAVDVFQLKAVLSNNISLNERLSKLDALVPHGLRVYGPSNWTEAHTFSLKLLSCYQAGKPVDDRATLVDIYQRSRIAINIPHHQAKDGLPYRIFDIMASDALLITDYREGSDLFKIFGDDMPVPMYRNTDELEFLVDYYLNNESERVRLVKKCNKLVSNGFTFEDVALDFYQMIGVELDRDAKCHGKKEIIDVSRFESFSGKLYGFLPSRVKTYSIVFSRLLLNYLFRVFLKITTHEQRVRIKKNLSSIVGYKVLNKVRKFI